MILRRISISVASAALMLATSSLAADLVDGNRESESKWIIEQSKAWADQACGGKWVISDLLADDFQGTSPKGTRYRKPDGEPAPDPNTKWSKDCKLDQAEVRYFGSDVAVAYGAESKTVTLADGKLERRCLVWTDTWLRRKGKWQIIAVQDNRIECPSN